MYIPPFQISAEAINMIADISRLVERYAILLENDDGLRLRKANRIRTIHSSLAIEGNQLSEDEVRDIIDGKNVVAPLREIQEVKNAIKTYEMYPTLDAFSERDLLRAHSQMMEAIVDNPGHYRTGGVGVFSEQGLVHLAPPASRVPELMSDLFHWLTSANDHLLIRSCVFHYEFEFIHPFLDGNGRIGRLWQSLVLGKLHPVFEHLPVENMVYSNQQQYYDAIAASTQAGNSGPFIDFMLKEIFETLRKHQGEELGTVSEKSSEIERKSSEKKEKSSEKILRIIEGNPKISASEIAKIIGISSRSIEKNIKKLRENGMIRRIGPDHGGYWEIVKEK